MPVIDASDIEAEFGTHFSDYEFAQMAANDSYVTVYCNEDRIEEFKEEIVSCSDEPEYCARLYNEITLIHYLRGLGYTDKVLVYISW
jgi:hypothetical protein